MTLENSIKIIMSEMKSQKRYSINKLKRAEKVLAKNKIVRIYDDGKYINICMKRSDE